MNITIIIVIVAVIWLFLAMAIVFCIAAGDPFMSAGRAGLVFLLFAVSMPVILVMVPFYLVGALITCAARRWRKNISAEQ